MRNFAKRAISLLCVLSMLFSMVVNSSAQTSTTVSVESQTIEQGAGTENVEVPIKISNNTGILGITISVTFDEELTLINAVKGDVLEDLTLTKPKNYEVKPYNLVWDGEGSADTGNGIVAVLTFTVPKGTAKDYAVNITTSGVFDEDVQPFEVTAVSGKISVVGGQQEPSSETTISVESQTIEQGTGTENVEVPIKVTNNTGILGITVSVNFDEDLTLVNAAKGDVFGGLTLTKPKDYTVRPYNLVWDGQEGADTDDGTIAVLTFAVPKGTAKDYAINITTSGVFDGDVKQFEPIAVSGKISVVGGQDYPSSETTVKVISQTIEQGTGNETVEVPIEVSNNTGILGMTVSVTFDDELSLTNVVKGDALSSLTFTTSKEYTDIPYNLVWDGQALAETSDGVIATLTFTVPKGTAKDYSISIETSGVFDGNVTEFTPNAVSGKVSVLSGDDETPNSPITTTTYKTLISTYKFSIECSQALTTEFLAIACYDNRGKLLMLKQVECDGDTSYTGSVPIDTNIDYTKIFVWSSLSSLKPLAGVEIVDIIN